MKFCKTLLAVLLIAVLAFGVTGCHKKNEIAVTVDGIEFTSAYYMCALLSAESEARTKVDEQMNKETADSDSAAASLTDAEYLKKKIDGTDFTKWVENRAIELLKQNATYKLLCQENKLEPDKDSLAYAEQYVAYYWSNGYSATFEPNGVSQATFTEYMKDSYYASRYFDFLYGEGGSKEISKDEVAAALAENYLLVDQLQADLSQMDEATVTETKEKFNGYLTALQSGTKTFKEIYYEYNNTQEQPAETETEDAPQDPLATVIGSDKTEYRSDNFETAKGMAVGEMKVLTVNDDKTLLLLVKKDLSADPYYVKNLDKPVRSLLKQDEFDADMEKIAAKKEATIHSSAIKIFKVKNIVHPSNEAAAS